MSNFLKTKKRYLLVLIHFLATFILERRILIFDLDKDIIGTIAKSDVISDSFERVMGYMLSKLFALIFIFFLWELVFFVLSNIKKAYVKFFTLLTIVGAVVLIFIWPGPFTESADNVITFSYALRLWPEYWHSAYTSIIYTACMMICPFAVSIGLFQWIFTIFVIGYLYKRIFESELLAAKGRFLVFLIVLMPGIYTLVTNPYRTEGYALITTYLLARVTLDIAEGKKATPLELVKLISIVAFVAVWRSEGIVLGLLSFGVYLIFAQGYKFGKVILLSIASVCVVGLVMLPQKLGDAKYYGKDYSFINSFVSLKNILNSGDANLTYDGAKEDLAALERVTPIPLLKKYGMEGYRRYNYANGRADINQSLADDETSAAYMKAYKNLVLHNLNIYLKTQASEIATMLMIKDSPLNLGYNAELEYEPDPWVLKAWEIGYEDVENYAKPAFGFGSDLYELVRKPFTVLNNLLSAVHFYTVLLILITLSQLVILVRELMLAIRKKAGNLGLGGIAFVLLAQFAAIALVVPESALVYLHAYYYSSFGFVLIYVLKIMGTKDRR